MWTASATPMTTSDRSLDMGRHESEAFSRAPEASWISRIRVPPLPMMDPIRTWGMRRRSGYVLEDAVDASFRGSLFRVRIISPNACPAC